MIRSFLKALLGKGLRGFGGEGGIRTHVACTHPLSRRRRYDRFGTSPSISAASLSLHSAQRAYLSSLLCGGLTASPCFAPSCFPYSAASLSLHSAHGAGAYQFKIFYQFKDNKVFLKP
jgi:hypothetical protein